MCEIGQAAGKKTVALITDMNQPLGQAVGNSLEVIEAIETLKGQGPADITELSLRLAGTMIYVGGKASSVEEGDAMAKDALESGRGLDKLRQFIAAQGGNPQVVDDYSLFGPAKLSLDIVSDSYGFVQKIKAESIGLASQHTGAGRLRKEDPVDLSAGIYLHKKVGDKVAAGDVLATAYGNDQAKLEIGAAEAMRAFVIGDDAPEKEALVKEVLGL